jgi:ubiquinone/menaquinone biosynthesis C-methylase UbiE
MPFDEPYSKFAKAYDQMMSNVNYPRWTDYMENLFAHYKHNPKKVLDLACGTGSLTILMAQRGCYEMWGVDKTAEMLEIARYKAERLGLKIHFSQQNMKDLTLDQKVDAVLCLYDSINYILTLEELVQVFKRVREVLADEGLFIFDVTTEHNIVKHFHMQTFAENQVDYSYIWKNVYSTYDKICRTHLTFFLKEGEYFQRHEELHLQKIFEVKEVKNALETAGFELLSSFDCYTFNKWHKFSDRINFTARKT